MTEFSRWDLTTAFDSVDIQSVKNAIKKKQYNFKTRAICKWNCLIVSMNDNTTSVTMISRQLDW